MATVTEATAWASWDRAIKGDTRFTLTITRTEMETRDVSMYSRSKKAKNWNEMEEMMSTVPQLPNITNLAIDAQWQHLEASIIKIVAKCSRLERLSIDILRPFDPCSNPHCFCNRDAGQEDWMIALERLQEVKITGLQPSKGHLSLVRHVIASAPALERMTVELYIGKELHCSSIPCSRGHWAPCASGQSSTRINNNVKAYEWTPDKKRQGRKTSEGK